MRGDQRRASRWTGETAQGYGTCMLKPTILVPLLFILGAVIGCKDDEPTAPEFGAACADEPPLCAAGLTCAMGYCAPTCESDADCPTIPEYRHECRTGVCWIVCNEKTLECPSDLDVPLTCQLGWCESSL